MFGKPPVEGGCTGANERVEAAEEGESGGEEGERGEERRSFTKRRCEIARQYRSGYPAYRSVVLRR